MLHWICPDCGNDCPPTVRECAACAAAPSKSIPSSEEAVTEGVLALARKLQPSSDTPLLEPVPQLLLTTVNGSEKTNGHSNGTQSIAPVSEEYFAIPEDETIASLVRPLVESVEAAADIEPLIDACVEAVAIAVEGAAVEAPETAPMVEMPTATLSAAAVEAPILETAGAIHVVEVLVALVPAPETLEAAPGVEISVATMRAAVEALALDILEAAPVVEVAAATLSAAVEEAPACETAETAPVVEIPVATLTGQEAGPTAHHSAAVEEAPVGETLEAAPGVEMPVATLTGQEACPTAHHSAAVEEAPVGETLETAPVVEMPIATLTGQEACPTAHHSAAVEEAPVGETLEAAPEVEVPVATLTGQEACPTALEECPVVDSPLLEPTYDPGPLCHALELHAETVLQVVHAQLAAVESGIRAIMAGFEAPPLFALLAAPREIVRAPALPATQWKRAPRPSIPCVRPGDPNSGALSAGPITSALAGPCLPADLRTLIEKKSSKSGRSKKRGKIPAWPISVLVATGLFLGAGSLMQYLASRDAAVSSASQRPAQGTAATSVAAAVDPHPFARFVEVTGLRVSADLNRKSQLQYLVVNHSSARLSDVALKISVRSTADSSGSAPLFSLSVVVPSLAPYQSKEIKTDLDAALRSTAIPDWENLRADVQVSTKQ